MNPHTDASHAALAAENVRLAYDNARLARVNAALVDALQMLHDNTAEYQRINNLRGYDNHDMRVARAAIASAKWPAVRFPVGGSRQPVYEFLSANGFTAAHGNDKEWVRADGLELHLYGAGSRAIIRKGYDTLADDALDAAVAKVSP
jgi:hypothetical protein